MLSRAHHPRANSPLPSSHALEALDLHTGAKVEGGHLVAAFHAWNSSQEMGLQLPQLAPTWLCIESSTTGGGIVDGIPKIPPDMLGIAYHVHIALPNECGHEL